MKKQVIKLNESQLRQVISESVKNVLRENFSLGMKEYTQYFESLSDDLVNSINNDTLFSNIFCQKRKGKQFGEYHLIINIPISNNFNSQKDAANEIEGLVADIASMVYCNEWQVYGNYMKNLHPKIGKGIFASVRFVKTIQLFKIDVDIPYYVMKNAVNETYPNVHLLPMFHSTGAYDG